jgi:hypothetical protein
MEVASKRSAMVEQSSLSRLLLESKKTAKVAVTIAANPLTTTLALLGASPMIRQLTMKVERTRNVTTIVKPSP